MYGNEWWSFKWDESEGRYSIAYKELYALVTAVNTWADRLTGKIICCMCDNLGAVEAVNWGAAVSRLPREESE